ncbi:MAG: hypothetical protein H7829_00975 [Magnetococcus sp. THC-1_WYH]
MYDFSTADKSKYPPALPGDIYSDEMAQDWLWDEKAHLNWLRQIPVLGKPMGIPGATVIDADYLNGLPPVTAEKKRDYLRGGLPDFAIVNAEVPVKLGVVAEGLDLLKRHRALLLVGPAGTGKTTNGIGLISPVLAC